MMFLIKCIDPPEEFILPTWDLTLNVSLASDTVFMNDLLVAEGDENLEIVDSPLWGDSIYLIVVKDIEASSGLQNKLQIPVPLVPGSLNLSGYTGGYEIKTATIYNPDPEYHIDTAEFISGELRFFMTNSSDFDAEYEIILPGFKDKDNGEMVVLGGTAAANSSTPISFPLSNVIYAELPVTGINDLENYSSQESTGFMVVGIARTANLLELNLMSKIDNSDITLSRLVGKLKRTNIEFFEETFTTNFDDNLKDFRDNIDFDDIRMYVEAQTFGQLRNVKIVFDSLTVIGREYETGTESILQFGDKNYFRDSLIAGTPFIREFNKTNTNLSEFLSRIPDEVVIGNKLYLEKNPDADDDTQVISNSDSVKFTATIQAPLKFAIKEVSYDDTTDIDFTQSEVDAINNANTADLTVEIESHIALGAKLKIIFLDEYYDELFVLSDDAGLEEFTLTPAVVNSEGKPVSSVIDRVAVSLTADEITLLAMSKHVKFEAYVSSTGSTADEFGPYVRVRAKDYFTYKIFGTVEYHVDVDELK